MSNKNRLRIILAERRIRQVELAREIGITNATLSDIVNEKRTPTLATARKIARALGMPLEEIWPEE